MNKKTKKIIAREFLIALIMVTLELFIFACISPYNSYQKKQINKIENSIRKKEKTAESLHKSVISNKEYALMLNEIFDLKMRRIELENKVLDEYKRMDLLTRIGTILFGFLFILRYLFYGAIWSIKTLKE